MVETFEAALPPADVLVPVPLHVSRLAERGYNQSTLLARRIAEQTGLPVLDGPLRRLRPTQPQMALPAERRLANIQGAFAVPEHDLRGLHVLLIDDVCTTGSTLEACAIALKAARCEKVWGLTLAKVP